MNTLSIEETLRRIRWALDQAVKAIRPFVPGAVEFDFKMGDDPVTEADRIANRVLRDELLSYGEGWLSEESVDDYSRLENRRVWVVDPLDGTREFVAGIPEWCISIGLVENGQAVAGGVCNPATGERFVGHVGFGLLYNGRTAFCSQTSCLKGATVLASRSEVKRGEWARLPGERFRVKADGFGRLQARTGGSRISRRNMDVVSKTRVGCCRWRSARQCGGRICRKAG